MDGQVDGKAPEARCPKCGLVIKVANQAPEACPVCGAKLPVAASNQKGKQKPKGPIMLDQALFKSPRARESWAPRELASVVLITFFAVMFINYLIVVSGASIIENEQFDPFLYFSINLGGTLIGMTPVIYVLVNKVGVKKLAFKAALGARQWWMVLALGSVFGIGLFLIQQLGDIINHATGLVPAVPRQVDLQYAAFIDDVGNRLFMLVPVAVAQVAGEFFYRGTVQNGIMQWVQKRVPPVPAPAAKLREWALSTLVGTLFDFSLFFNPSTILPGLLAHALLGVLFLKTRNVQSGMIAQGIYMVLAILII